ncbi:hypothetical protein WCLP8_1470001 [uncultured Gammaproteobacteria bacterium]
MIIVPDGRVVYSVTKSGYFATTLGSGNDSRLARLHQLLQTNTSQLTAFAEFAYDEAIGDNVTGILAGALRRADGTLIGIVALVVPVEPVDAVVRSAAGLGETGQTYLVGADLNLRTSARLAEQPTILKQKVDTPAVRAGLAGDSGVIEFDGFAAGTRQQRSLMIAFAPYNFFGIHYALIAEAGLVEVLQPLHRMRAGALSWGLAVLVAVALAGIWLARGIVDPLAGITGAMLHLADGELETTIPGVGREDEIGALARALLVFRENLIEVHRLQLAREKDAAAQRRLLEAIPLPLLVTSRDEKRILHLNQPAAELFGIDRKQAVGQATPDYIVDARDRNRLLEALRLQGQVDEFEISVRTPRTEPYWALLSARALSYQDQDAVLVALNGINERKRAEELQRIAAHRLAEANRQITASIQYASRIQTALLGSEQRLATVVPDHVLIWQPRDIVGGDFHWVHRWADGRGAVVVVADCTGHGVPGALMTMIACTLLDRVLVDGNHDDPAKILSELSRLIKSALGQDQSHGPSDDGAEAGVCCIDFAQRRLTFAGARFALWVGHNAPDPNGANVVEIRGDRMGIGFRTTPQHPQFTNHGLHIEPRTSFFLATDGVTDQVGGTENRAFGRRRLLALLNEVVAAGGALHEHKSRILDELERFRGHEARRDDLTLLGFCVHNEGPV